MGLVFGSIFVVAGTLSPVSSNLKFFFLISNNFIERNYKVTLGVYMLQRKLRMKRAKI